MNYSSNCLPSCLWLGEVFFFLLVSAQGTFSRGAFPDVADQLRHHHGLCHHHVLLTLNVWYKWAQVISTHMCDTSILARLPHKTLSSLWAGPLHVFTPGHLIQSLQLSRHSVNLWNKWKVKSSPDGRAKTRCSQSRQQGAVEEKGQVMWVQVPALSLGCWHHCM